MINAAAISFDDLFLGMKVGASPCFWTNLASIVIFESLDVDDVETPPVRAGFRFCSWKERMAAPFRVLFLWFGEFEPASALRFAHIFDDASAFEKR